MGMKVHDKEGKEINPIMGCYGIGVGRALACVAEESCDEKGLIWPITIAPWHIVVCPLRYNDELIKQQTDNIYNELSKKYEVLLDDRNVSTGVKLADSELMGIPVRILISPRSLQENNVEITIRKTKETRLVKLENLNDELDQIIKDLYEELK